MALALCLVRPTACSVILHLHLLLVASSTGALGLRLAASTCSTVLLLHLHLHRLSREAEHTWHLLLLLHLHLLVKCWERRADTRGWLGLLRLALALGSLSWGFDCTGRQPPRLLCKAGTKTWAHRTLVARLVTGLEWHSSPIRRIDRPNFLSIEGQVDWSYRTDRAGAS